MITISMNHICLDDRGVAYIAGTKMKVRQIVIEKNVWGLTPEEIQQGHDHLSLAQIHAALAYYYDHQEKIDAEIERTNREVDELRAQQPKQLTRQELEARTLLKKAPLVPGRATLSP